MRSVALLNGSNKEYTQWHGPGSRQTPLKVATARRVRRLDLALINTKKCLEKSEFMAFSLAVPVLRT